MNTRKPSLILAFALFLSACNLPTNAPPVAEEIVEPSSTLENTSLPPEDTAIPIPSETPLPTETSLPTATSTPSVPIAWPKDANVNCRFGYGTDWLAVAALVVDQPATIIGKNNSGTWWYITPPNAPGTSCWVAASVTNTAGNLAGLPVINQSTASVTKVTIEKPDTISVPGCMGPIQPLELNGSIETNGPGAVEWHFESEQGGVLASHTTNFDNFGVKNASDSFVPPLVVGSYWVKLVTTSPNGKVAENSYQIECP